MEDVILLSELTPTQYTILCGGCGAKDGWRKLPQWHSRTTCDRHDLAYWVGGTEEDRARADRELLNGMIRDAETRPWWQQPWYRMMAWYYYAGVRNLGQRFFSQQRRTRADLP